MIKYWLRADTTWPNTYSGLPIPYIDVAEAIMNNASILPREELLGYYQFAAMDRSVRLGSSWAAGLAMHSNRISNYESINDENLKGWNTGNGMLYVYTADQL